MPKQFKRKRMSRSQRYLNYAKVGATVASTAFTALKVAQGLAAIINTEFKHYDVEFAAGVSNTGSVSIISNMAGGTTSVTRTGNVILPKGLSVKMQFDIHASATVDSVIRIMIIKDSQQDGTAPTIAQILDTVAPLAHMNLDNQPRFRILKDKIVILRLTSVISANVTICNFC